MLFFSSILVQILSQIYANAFWSWVHTILYITVFIFTGDVLRYEDGQSPLHSLEQAAVHYASAITLSWRDARLHFLLGVVLEEQHYATLMYGLQRKVWWPAAAKHAWLNSSFKSFLFEAINTFIAGSCSLQDPLSRWPSKIPAETLSGNAPSSRSFFSISYQTHLKCPGK